MSLLLLLFDSGTSTIGRGIASGTSLVNSFSLATKASKGLANGLSLPLADAISTSEARGLAAGTSSAIGSTNTFGLSFGTSSVLAESFATKASRGLSTATSLVIAQSGSFGTSIGTSSAIARSSNLGSVGASSGLANVQGISLSGSFAVGHSSGSASVIGQSPQIASAIGFSQGFSFGFGVGSFLSAFSGELPAALKLAYEKQSFIFFCAIKIQFPDYTLRLLDSSTRANINSELYVGIDTQLGSLVTIDTISDGTGDSAPSVRIVCLPPDEIASYAFLSSENQGSPVQIFIGAFEQSTGTLIDVHEVFAAEIDQVTLEIGEGLRQVTIDCVSVFERFFEDDEGVRLTHSWHNAVWPGEQGLIYVTDIERQIPWGANAPLPSPVSAVKSNTQIGVDFNQFRF